MRWIPISQHGRRTRKVNLLTCCRCAERELCAKTTFRVTGLKDRKKFLPQTTHCVLDGKQCRHRFLKERKLDTQGQTGYVNLCSAIMNPAQVAAFILCRQSQWQCDANAVSPTHVHVNQKGQPISRKLAINERRF